jgi:hypothetical protein
MQHYHNFCLKTKLKTLFPTMPCFNPFFYCFKLPYDDPVIVALCTLYFVYLFPVLY